MDRKSKRFRPSRWTEILIPLALALLVIGLLAVFAILLFSSLTGPA
jgi:competence protein ComGF